ncbi:hypothetical protein ZIOFF_063129 [Zingiber officinale]|uniref:Transposase n=1 Tax=Zingiber officinale TaxID=94328 RepID=A0A8J5F234_ZINOF|nr:hypothetical protein ZIOFF_063129 [Zingiber officinale]
MGVLRVELQKYGLQLNKQHVHRARKKSIELVNGAIVPSVKRFICGLDALRKGFLEGCKPSIGFDGCHLKGPYGDVLLSAIGLDGNNRLFPIAFTIVESESKSIFPPIILGKLFWTAARAYTERDFKDGIGKLFPNL